MTPRYQNGTLETRKTSEGDCYYLRFLAADGKRPRIRLGLKADFSKATDLKKKIRDERAKYNAGDYTAAPVFTVGKLLDRYEAEEMPQRFSTACGYRKLHKVIRARWADTPLDQIAPLDVRAWLRDLRLRNGELASTRTRGHVHTHFKNLLKHGMLWKWMVPQVNPLSLFSLEGATKRTKTPKVVSPEDFRRLLDYWSKPTDRRKDPDQLMLAMVLPAYCLGLRISELIGLKWQDIDHLNQTVHIRRAVVRGREGKVKTERSEAPLPLAPTVADAFRRWHAVAPFRLDHEWVFGSALKCGETPIDARKLQSTRLRTAGHAVLGKDFSLGWHTFRHSYKSLLDTVTTDLTLKRDLMRHADTHTTANVYGYNEVERLRVANQAAVDLALPARVN